MTTVPYSEAEIDRLAHLIFAEFGREMCRWSPAGEALDVGGGLLGATAHPFPFLLNALVRLDDDADPERLIALADRFFTERGRGFTVPARAGIDDDLAQAAEAAGLQQFGDSPEMICYQRLEEAEPPPGVELHPVTDAAGVADFIHVATKSFATLGEPEDVLPTVLECPERLLEPHIATVVATVDGVPTATALTHLAYGIAAVEWVGTLEAGRGKGLGELVTRWVTNAGFDLGAQAQTLEASPMGEPVYARMGYEERYRYAWWVRWEAPS